MKAWKDLPVKGDRKMYTTFFKTNALKHRKQRKLCPRLVGCNNHFNSLKVF